VNALIIANTSAGMLTLLWCFGVTQVLYFFSLLVVGYFYTRPTDVIRTDGSVPAGFQYPQIILLYPVLRESIDTMRTTFLGLNKIEYPKDRYRIVAIPNFDDDATRQSLEVLAGEFPWLEILAVPSTSDESWNKVWHEWSENSKAYWWHEGKRAQVRTLPAKKTRQLIYAFYTLCDRADGNTLVSYIDADSVPPANYFALGAVAAAQYDVVQLTNVAGNLLTTWASSFHAFDHMCWDATMYPHMTAHGKHPYYVLGKGLFFHASDLYQFGGFHPWITIEDPEVGMRLWTNGCKLGVVRQPLIEEVPRTFRQGVTQRKRWICGFFQSLGTPLKKMGMSAPKRLRARLTLVLNVAFLLNPVGLAIGIWILVLTLNGHRPTDLPLEVLSLVNIAMLGVVATPATEIFSSSESGVRDDVLALLDDSGDHRHQHVRKRPRFNVGEDREG
jgi:cellulose synthase/poly-beta-1,6-N-acetylglucosamine synthase-like glycosyltransferase